MARLILAAAAASILTFSADPVLAGSMIDGFGDDRQQEAVRATPQVHPAGHVRERHRTWFGRGHMRKHHRSRSHKSDAGEHDRWRVEDFRARKRLPSRPSQFWPLFDQRPTVRHGHRPHRGFKGHRFFPRSRIGPRHRFRSHDRHNSWADRRSWHWQR